MRRAGCQEMEEHRAIDVEDLIVDEKNPRFPAVSTEDDALRSILADQALGTGNKILNLARDIAEHGLNASELLIVSPIEGTDTYRVREGNRRVTAIKLSLFSERIPDDFRELVPQFKKLMGAMQAHRFIECCICDDEREIRRLLLLRHGGENNGVGTVKWNSTQTARFNEAGSPQTARALSLIEHLKEDYGQGDLWRTAAAIPPTNLGRLITTPEIRQLLNINFTGNDAHYQGNHDKLLLDVLSTLKSKGVAAIYNKDARVRLVAEAKERTEPEGLKQTRLSLDNATYDRTNGPSRCNDNGVATATRQPHTGEGSSERFLQPGFQSATQPQVPTEVAEFERRDHDASDKRELNENRSDVEIAVNAARRKPVRYDADRGMFGHALRPKGIKSNNIYRGIDWIDKQYLKRPDELAHLLPILGFSLRLLMESVAREYFASINEDRGDKSLSSFLKDIAKPAIAAKIDSVGRNNLALASEWIDGKYTFEALFAKWAHGTLTVERSALVRQSELVALIIDEVWT
jgi:hypothetical protein